MPFVEEVGKAGTAPLPQIVRAFPKLNIGVNLVSIVTVNVMGKPHSPEAGVNVYTPEF